MTQLLESGGTDDFGLSPSVCTLDGMGSGACNPVDGYVFECMVNKSWLRVAPSIAIYDLGFSEDIDAAIKNMMGGSCLKGVSGAAYRLTNRPDQLLSSNVDTWNLYMDVFSKRRLGR